MWVPPNWADPGDQAHTCSPSLLIYREGRRDPLLQGIANQIAFYLLRNSILLFFSKKYVEMTCEKDWYLIFFNGS